MKILIVTNMYPSPGDESWRGVFVKEQVDTLHDLYPDMCLDVLHIKGAISREGSNWNYLTGLWRYLVMRNNKKYDAIWAQHSFCVFLASVCRKIPLVYSVHEGVPAQGLKLAVVDKAIALSDSVVYVSKKAFESSRHPRKFLLPSGIDTEKFRCLDKTECLARLGLVRNRFYVLFPASPRRPEKNADFAYSFINEHSSWLLSENIEFIFGGDIEHELMPVWLNAVDCLVSFSDFESDGVVFKEAMACNLPVITFDVGNAQIYFKDELAGSIIDRSYDSLKEKLAHWKSRGRTNGREYLLALEIDKQSIARKLKNIFKETADGRN
jgi:teichuronic acid biosynthesis glycosyltransferase TuaC